MYGQEMFTAIGFPTVVEVLGESFFVKENEKILEYLYVVLTTNNYKGLNIKDGLVIGEDMIGLEGLCGVLAHNKAGRELNPGDVDLGKKGFCLLCLCMVTRDNHMSRCSVRAHGVRAAAPTLVSSNVLNMGALIGDVLHGLFVKMYFVGTYGRVSGYEGLITNRHMRKFLELVDNQDIVDLFHLDPHNNDHKWGTVFEFAFNQFPYFRDRYIRYTFSEFSDRTYDEAYKVLFERCAKRMEQMPWLLQNYRVSQPVADQEMVVKPHESCLQGPDQPESSASLFRQCVDSVGNCAFPWVGSNGQIRLE